MATSGASSSSPSTYDVFLSFRGEDTRNNFTAHLHNALRQRGINTYIDEELRRGEEISPALFKAIEESRISILVLSENYASSTWCLDELKKILECKRTRQQIVLPIFYLVDPSEVWHQRKSFGQALTKHEDRFKDDHMKIQKWKESLKEVAKLSGFHLKKEGNESRFIHEIIQWVDSKIIYHTELHIAKYPVGIESRVQDISLLLSIETKDIRMVGIFGVGGIGKTTIAKAVFNLNAYRFEASCFLPNVRETSNRKCGILRLQETLLSKILGGSSLNVSTDDQGINVIKERFHCKRILLVIDDVDQLEQLEKLVGDHDWFGLGTRIIITTRDQSLLTNHKVDSTYEMKKLDRKEACELFSWNAFKRNKPNDEYVDLAKYIIRYSGGLPLALKVLGSDLYGRSIHEWISALNDYKRVPHQDIQKILRTSYDGLRENEKNIFLDIACFFKGERAEYVIKILDNCGFSPDIGLEKLVDKCLITIDEHNILGMHDLLQEMGRELVREESPKEPGKRSRLWFYEDVRHVLEENTGTNKVEGIVVDIPKGDDRICLSPKAFVKMKNLRLFINRNARFSGRLSYLPNELRMLDWPECPLQSLPSNFHGKKLVEFRMPSSHIKELGQGFESSPNLTIMDFSYCESLIKIPDLSGSHSLKKLNLSCCTNLVEIHNSVGFLDKLVSWSLFGCSNLRGLPRSLKLRSLEWLNFYGCSSLTDFPEIECEMKHLRQIGLEYTAIKELPSSIGNLTGLQSLYLKGCKNLIRLPSSILQLQHLESLHLNDCPNLVKNVGDNKQSMASEYETSSNAELRPLLPVSDSSISDDDYSTIAFPLYLESSVLSKSSFLRKSNCLTTLSWLDLSGSDIVSLPESIKGFVGLRRLYVRNCKKLQEIPKLPPNIVEVYASGCKSLESFPEVTRKLQFNICDLQALDFIDLSGCDKLLLSIRNHVANPLLCKGHDYLDGIVFPANRIPDWFSHRKEILERNSCEIDISGHQCLDDEIRGIALCAIVGPVLSLHPRPIVSARIIGNGILRYIQKQTFNLFASDGAQMGSDHVWLGYSVLQSFELKGENLRVEFFTERSSMFFKGCGAHLVHKHEKSAEDYPSVLHEKVDNIEETEISVDLMEGNQLSKRHLDEDDDPNLELNWYPLEKRHCSTSGIKILDLENPQGLKDSKEDLNLELDF